MKHCFLVLNIDGVVTGTDKLESAELKLNVPHNYFAVPESVLDKVVENPTQVYRVVQGDVETVELPVTIEQYQSSAVTAIIHHMHNVLQEGIVKKSGDSEYSFPCTEEVVMQLTMFSNCVAPVYMKVLNNASGYYEAVLFTPTEVQNIQNELANHWSNANKKYLDALNNVNDSTSLGEISNICHAVGVKVL